MIQKIDIKCLFNKHTYIFSIYIFFTKKFFPRHPILEHDLAVVFLKNKTFTNINIFDDSGDV